MSVDTKNESNGGRRKFQIDLGISIINRVIEEDWASPYRADDKPVWMKKNVVPCACKQCFFCIKNNTKNVCIRKEKKKCT